MNIRTLRKLPKRKVTVGDLLRLDDIQSILQYVDRRKEDITCLVVGVQWSDGSATWMADKATTKDIIWLLEQIKHQLLEETVDTEH